MKRVKPKMTHNDGFFFSLFCVGSSQELALSARCNMKEQFHSFEWHRKILFNVHSNFMPAAGVSAGEFYVLPLYFKDCKSQKKSVCHQQGHGGTEGCRMRTLKACVCVDKDLIAVSGLKRKQNRFAWDQTRSHLTGSWSVHLHYIHYPLAPPHRVRAHVTQCWPKSLMQSLWEPLSVDRHQTGLTTAHLLPWHNTY